MTSPRQAPLVAASAPDPHRVLARHGRSFHWAGLFLNATQRHDAAVLYSFCRWADDLVDESADPATAVERVAQQVGIGATHFPSHATEPRVAAFLALSERLHFDPATLRHFVEGLRTDCGMVRFEHSDQLIRYAYGVASTVGLWMCAILGVEEPAARPFAIDLGIAMQLTNISRDVLEDAQRGRVYLPLPEGVTAAGLVANAPGQREAARVEVLRTLQLADRYYRSADRGLRFLPARARFAILVASRVYEAIGRRLTREGVARIERRAVVPPLGKLATTLGAVAEFVGRPMLHGRRALPRHDSTLHAPLAGWLCATGTAS